MPKNNIAIFLPIPEKALTYLFHPTYLSGNPFLKKTFITGLRSVFSKN